MIRSTPSAFPPRDAGQNIVVPQIMEYDLSKVIPAYETQLSGKMRLFRIAFMSGVGMSAFLVTDSMWWSLIGVLAAGVLLAIVGRLVFFFSINSSKSQEKEARNKMLYQELFSLTESNFLSSLFIVSAVKSGVRLYEAGYSEAMRAIAQHAKKEYGLGQVQCSTGHGMMCAHRAPANLNRWANEQD